MFQSPPETDHRMPSRWGDIVFFLKAGVLRWVRRWRDFGSFPALHLPGDPSTEMAVTVEKRSPLWGAADAAEFPLTAGKVENLRIAARAFHKLGIPAGAVLSFWRQLGRPVRRRGFVSGRELRTGCVIPAVGGGLCQLSGLLHQAALEAGLEILERHAHSRNVPGAATAAGLDATVFWNYVDWRVKSPASWRLEVFLTTSELVVRIGVESAVHATTSPPVPYPSPVVKTPENVLPVDSRASSTGDCLTCGMVECFRHPSATASHAPSLGHTAFLLDSCWPEFNTWCAGHTRPGDRWQTPLDGLRWKKPNYAWMPGPGVKWECATALTLFRSVRQRRLPAQGAVRQRSLLAGESALAGRYARRLLPECRHVVVSQNLLPHLWLTGALAGRTFDVLIQRWPMVDLQHRLDEALAAHPDSPTLGDFRAPPDLLNAETEALAAAARLITPHRAIAASFGSRALLLDWNPATPVNPVPPDHPTVFFPASRLARKGVYELAEALRQFPGVQTKVLGRASESPADPLSEIPWSPATAADLSGSTVLVLPAWVEHQPRLALQALASGIPVIATAACGLPAHPLLQCLSSPDAASLQSALTIVFQNHRHPGNPADSAIPGTPAPNGN